MRVILLFLLIPFISTAQFEFGISSGLNYGDVFIPIMHERDKVENNAMRFSPAFNSGLSLTFRKNQISILSGFYFSRRRTKLASESMYQQPGINHASLNFYFWEIPLIARYRFLKDKLEVGGGIINALIIDADINIGINFYNPYQLDLKATFGWYPIERLNFEVGFLYGGLNHIFHKDDLFYYGHSVFNLNLNYRFWSLDFRKRSKRNKPPK